MWLKFLLLHFLSTSIFAKINLNPLEEDTTVPIPGRVCAYADMNKDQYTDIIVHNYINRTVSILLQSAKENLRFDTYKSLKEIKLSSSAGWVYCSVADFNGDSLPDIMITAEDRKYDDQVKSTIYLQNDGDWESVDLDTSFLGQPSVLDVNGDGVGDVVGFDKDKKFYCLKGYVKNQGHGFENCTQLFDKYKDGMKREPYKDFSTIFSDITGDLSAEIIFGVKDDDGRLKLEVFSLPSYDPFSQEDEETWEFNESLTSRLALPREVGTTKVQNLANPIVADFDADGNIEILLPVCVKEDCKQVNTILMWTMKRGWIYFNFDMKDVEFYRDNNRPDFLFRVGDFSLDGFPDLIVTVVKENRAMPMILENVEYVDNANFSRKFDMKSGTRFVMPAEMAAGNVKMSAFFDLKEDGNLDILVEYGAGNDLNFDFIKCDDKGDSTFLKVLVFTNVCDWCDPALGTEQAAKREKIKGSGVSWHGACASFSTTDSWGNARLSSQCQIPQTSHRALYSPYVLFGLGRSPNFVDLLKFGAPRPVDPYGYQHHTIPQIVPNSRIIVIPPKGTSTSWTTRLFLTPSSLIIQSLFVLMTVCGLLLLVVIVLHMREKHQDKKERQAMSHRFHFDAM